MWEFFKKLLGTTQTVPMQEGLGAILNDEDSRDIQLDSFQEDIELPEIHITDTSMLEIYNQGAFGTCVAHVLAEKKQFNEYMDTGKLTTFSRRFIYHFARLFSGLLDSSDEGLSPRIAVKALMEKGVSESSLWPEVSTSHKEYSNLSPTLSAIENGADYRISGYAFGGVGERDIKKALVNNKVLGLSIPVDRNAWDRKTGRVKKPNLKNISGRHYILIIGYSIHRFFFLNSWGKDWGTSGYGSFDFRDYDGLIRDVMAITDIPQKLIEEAKDKPYVFSATLRKGSRGEAVKQLQKKLTQLDFFDGNADGIFGEMTHIAVFNFQLHHNLDADGIVGQETNNILNGGENKKKELVDALIQVESQGNDKAIGDKHLTDKAYGCLQIRKPCISDVNKAFGTNYKAEDMLGNRELSIWVFEKYMSLYATEKNIGRAVTDEDRARVWNGGPAGYKKTSTLSYWNKVKVLL